MKDILIFARSRKFYVALTTFVLALLQIYLPGQLWYAPLITFLGAIGVFSVPNQIPLERKLGAK